MMIAKEAKKTGYKNRTVGDTSTLVPGAGESKHEKFVRLGVSRINRALTTMRLIGNLASPAYNWTEEDIAAMRISLSAGLEATLNKFQPKKPPARSAKLETLLKELEKK